MRGAFVRYTRRMQPYNSENLIFIDTEFSDLDPYKGEILSIGIVKLNGDELYIELEQPEEVSPWVAKHLIPSMSEPKLTKQEANQVVREFLGKSMPYAVAFVDNYDVIYLTKIFGHGKLPFQWMTIDFASVLFALGINPVKFSVEDKGAKAFYKSLGIDTSKYKMHHALDDAKILREAWLKMISL